MFVSFTNCMFHKQTKKTIARLELLVVLITDTKCYDRRMLMLTTRTSPMLRRRNPMTSQDLGEKHRNVCCLLLP